MNTPSLPTSRTSLLRPDRKALDRRRTRSLLLATSAFALALTLGCATHPEPEQPFETTKYTLENTDKFAVLADPVAPPIACTGLQQRTLADGRLEIVANLKNREQRKVVVQANCLFKTDAPEDVGIETPWQTVMLAEDTTQTVRFVAPNATAKKYTVRVRTAR
jgi:hypothetical protein